MLFQIELHEFQWLNFDQGDHFGFTFSNEGVVSYDSDRSDYCDGQVCLFDNFCCPNDTLMRRDVTVAPPI